MRAPGQIFSSLLGRSFSAPASANERTAPNAIFSWASPLTAEINDDLRLTMIPDRSFEISGTKPLSKGWMQSSRCTLFGFLLDLHERCDHDLQVSFWNSTLPVTVTRLSVSPGKNASPPKRETSLARMATVSCLAVRALGWLSTMYYSGFVGCRFLYAAVNLKRPGRCPARSISSCSSLSNRQSSGVCSSVPVNLIGQSSVLPRLAWRNRCSLMAARSSRVVLLVRRRLGIL